MYDGELAACAKRIEEEVRISVQRVEHVDRISCRVKAVDRFLTKATKVECGVKYYSSPLREIQDIIGIRILVLYLQDVELAFGAVKEYFRSIEVADVKPASEDEFSYFGKHGIFLIPDDCKVSSPSDDHPKHFELQVKTLFQHAWAEAEHDLRFKPQSGSLTAAESRLCGFAASLSWGADKAFDDVLRSVEGRKPQ